VVGRELEQTLGQNLRERRLAQRLTQAELADLANVSVGAIRSLESGAGSSTATLVKALRALGADDVIAAVAPKRAPFNPLDLLDPRPRAASPKRVRHRAVEHR
jgi:transcriptional regulator with XRE-family HTH domain